MDKLFEMTNQKLKVQKSNQISSVAEFWHLVQETLRVFKATLENINVTPNIFGVDKR